MVLVTEPPQRATAPSTHALSSRVGGKLFQTRGQGQTLVPPIPNRATLRAIWNKGGTDGAQRPQAASTGEGGAPNQRGLLRREAEVHQ